LATAIENCSAETNPSSARRPMRSNQSRFFT
jgi:hypothetical protein